MKRRGRKLASNVVKRAKVTLTLPTDMLNYIARFCDDSEAVVIATVDSLGAREFNLEVAARKAHFHVLEWLHTHRPVVYPRFQFGFEIKNGQRVEHKCKNGVFRDCEEEGCNISVVMDTDISVHRWLVDRGEALYTRYCLDYARWNGYQDLSKLLIGNFYDSDEDSIPPFDPYYNSDYEFLN